MIEPVSTNALREIAVREDRESDTFIDDDFADERYWELREVADALSTAADEIDALRARAERAEAVIAEIRAWRSTWKEWTTTSRASQPASEVEQ